MPSRPDRAIRGGYFAPRDSFVNGRPHSRAAWAPPADPTPVAQAKNAAPPNLPAVASLTPW